MVKITLTRQVPPTVRQVVLNSAELSLASGGTAEVSTSVMKSRHETAKNAISNIR